MKKTLIITIVAVCATCIVSVPAHAEDGYRGRPMPPPRETVYEQMMERKEQISEIKEMRPSSQAELKDAREKMMLPIKQLRQENMSDRCKMITTRVQKVSSSAEMGIGGRQKAFGKVLERLTKLSANLAEKGMNVTTLTAALETLKEKVAKLNTDYLAFTTLLSTTRQMGCETRLSGTPTPPTAEVAAAFELVRADQKDIETFMKTDIRSALEALRPPKPTGGTEIESTPTVEIQNAR